MTDIEPAHPKAVEGLEDIGAGDLVLPILKLDHRENGFQDSLTNEIHKSLPVILLGVVKQRILWPSEPGAEGEGPICRSYNFAEGHPDADKFIRLIETPKGHPTGFDHDAIRAGGLACGSCPLKDWGTHPRGDKPWCDEQWTVPLLIIQPDGGFSPALISFQRTGIKPIKNYVTAFHSRNAPLYTAITRLEPQQQFKGTNPYSVPKFIKTGDSDPVDWPHFSNSFARIRAFITTPRARRDDDDAASGAPTMAPTAAASAPAHAPAAATAEVATEAPVHRAAPAPVGDEEPF